MPVPIPHILRVAARAAEAADADLLDRFARGRDEGAFAELVRRHGPAVYRVCRRIAGPASADDAFQAAFLVLATRHRAARRAASVAGWLVGVAGRVARQVRRAESRRARREAAAAVPERVEEVGAGLGDQLRVLDEELAGLPDRLRGPVVLCLLEGRSQESAAGELGQSPRTVRRRLEEARRLLRLRLERRGVIPALAAGLVANVGSAGAVPGGLRDRTVAVVFEYLTGGAGSLPPVVLANGVGATMLARNVWALMVAAAVGLTALGVGLAGGQGTGRNPAAQPPGQADPNARPLGRAVEAGGVSAGEYKFVGTSGDRRPFEKAIAEQAAAGWEFAGSERVRDEQTGMTVLVLVFRRPAGGAKAAGPVTTDPMAPRPGTAAPAGGGSNFNRAGGGEGADRKAEVFKLSHGKADEVAKLLQDTLGRNAVVAAEPVTNSVVVAAPAATLADVRRMLAAVDASAPAAGVKPGLIPLKRAGAQVVAEILGRIYTDPSQVRVTFDAKSNTLSVAASPATQAEIMELCRKLDADRAEKP